MPGEEMKKQVSMLETFHAMDQLQLDEVKNDGHTPTTLQLSSCISLLSGVPTIPWNLPVSLPRLYLLLM